MASAAQIVHGAFPETENDVPAAHATLHTVSVASVQAVFTPASPHVESAAHASHGALPVAEKIEPTQATWHSVSVVVVQVVFTPRGHVESPAHAPQGSVPVPENDVPPTHGGIAPLQTMSEPGVQAVLTPAAPHVESTAQVVHGVYPDVEKVEPAAHATLHTVSAVGVQAVFTLGRNGPYFPPAAHVASAAHVVQGAFPESEKDVPAAHATWHTVSVVGVQAVFTPAAHVELAAHAVQGAFPEGEKDVSAGHATRHTVSDVMVQPFLTPAVHMASAAQVVHGAFPETENDVPAAHAMLHTGLPLLAYLL